MMSFCNVIINVECCSITSQTIQRVVDSIDPGCVLAQLWLGIIVLVILVINEGFLFQQKLKQTSFLYLRLPQNLKKKLNKPFP